MKRAEIVEELEGKKASELARLAGTSLGRGRPSRELRDGLIEAVLEQIAVKRVKVTRDGDFVVA